MAKISIDRGNPDERKSFLVGKTANQICQAINEWFDTLGSKLELVEVVTIRGQIREPFEYDDIFIRIVIVDPMVVLDGRIISDEKRPRLEDGTMIRLKRYDNGLIRAVGGNWGDKESTRLKVDLDNCFRRTLEHRALILRENAKGIDEVLSKK